MLIICRNRFRSVFVKKGYLDSLPITTRIPFQFKEVYAPLMPENEFLELIVHFLNLTISLPLKKVKKVQEECSKMYKNGCTSILELTELLWLLASASKAV